MQGECRSVACESPGQNAVALSARVKDRSIVCWDVIRWSTHQGMADADVCVLPNPRMLLNARAAARLLSNRTVRLLQEIATSCNRVARPRDIVTTQAPSRATVSEDQTMTLICKLAKRTIAPLF